MKSAQLSAVATVLFLSPALAFAGSHNHKKQDADYVTEWCSANKGLPQVRVSSQSRVDCLTASHAVEIDFADKWETNITQALRYGRDSGKAAKLVLVIEDKSELKHYQEALKHVRSKRLSLAIDKHENYQSYQKSFVSIQGPPVKRSLSGNICHLKNKGSYGATKTYLSYSSLEECLNAGGKKPKNISL